MLLTADLKVNYKRPMRSDSVYLVRVWVDRVEKRKKIFLDATISDAEGKLLVEANALYIARRRQPLRVATNDI